MAPQGGIRTADKLLYRPDCLWELHLTERWKKGDKKKKGEEDTLLCLYLLRFFYAFIVIYPVIPLRPTEILIEGEGH